MKFSVEKQALLPLLTRVNNVVEKKSTAKINTHLLVSIKDNQLSLIGFDREIIISGTVSANIIEVGETTVTAQKFYDIVKAFPQGAELLISLKNNLLHVESGKSSFKLATIPAEEFPLPEQYEFEHNVEMPAKELVRLFNLVKFSMAANDVRQYLNGLLLDFNQSGLFAVSTDGHRLSASETPNTFGLTDKQIIIPGKTIKELSAWLDDTESNITLAISDSHIQVRYQSMSLTSSLINATYPAYETVIPKKAKELIIVAKSDIKEALNRAKILTSEFGLGVSMKFSPWKLVLSSQNMDNESASEEIEINYQGEEINTAFNINYLLNVIDVIDNENITISILSEQSSCLIFDAEKEDSRYIVMPMNI